jgi:hypothetical protein
VPGKSQHIVVLLVKLDADATSKALQLAASLEDDAEILN